MFVGIYQKDFTTSLEYPRLALDFPTHNSLYSPWDPITRGNSRDSRKASHIQYPTHYYIHSLLSRMIAEWGNSLRVMMRLDFYMMHSIIASYPINMGHVVAELIARHGQSPKLDTIFTRPYITCLVLGCGSFSTFDRWSESRVHCHLNWLFYALLW